MSLLPSLALLAGGRSSRFGGDKAYARSGERWPLGELFDRLRPAAEEWLVIGGDPALAAALQAAHHEDALRDAGPLAGIHAALSAATRDLVLIVPCDMPRLPGEMAAVFLRRLGECDALLLRRDAIPVPVCGLYRRSLAGPLALALAGGTRKITDALEGQRIGYLDAEQLAADELNPDDFLGFNTREEFARLFPVTR